MSPRRLLTAFLILTSLLGAADSSAERRRAIGPQALEQVTASIIAAPQPVIVNGVPHMAWEIVLRNDRSEEITVTTVDVIAGGAVFASHSGGALRERILNLPVRTNASPVVGAGESAIIYLLIQPVDVPSFITHVIQLSSPRGAETLYGPLTPVRLDPPIAFSAPLQGRSWLAANGLDNDSGHRRALVVLDGRMTIPQRYAIDWVQLDERGSTFTGDVRSNSSFYAYGRELLAVADGTITGTKDGIPENVPRQAPVVPITLDTIAGNYVILDVGEGKWVLYAHLQPGSLRVKVGDRVTKGTVLGLLGNSGNSTEPHLHFHLCDRNATIACDGLPYVFDHFSTTEGRKRLELPMNNAIVDFEN